MALLNLRHLKNKYSLDVKKIIHVGAHNGQEVFEYNDVFSNVEMHLFEPQKKIFSHLSNNFGAEENINLYHFGLGSSNGFYEMYISDNNGQSSSFLKPKYHLVEHPEVKFYEESLRFEIKVLDDLIIENIDLLNIDTQGFEMEVLKGSINSLNNDVKYLIIEINKKEHYHGCPMVKDIDNFLSKYGFIRTDTHYWLDSHSWGDAFYIKKNLISFKRRIYSRFKNYIYSFELLYSSIISLRNIMWKLRKKNFN